MKSNHSNKTLNESNRPTGPIKKGQSLTILQLLRVFNPVNKGFIELEDMKNLLKKIPEPQVSIIKNLFYAWIFSHQNFKLPVKSFVSLYETHMKTLAEKRNSNEKLKHKESVRSSTPMNLARTITRNTENRDEKTGPKVVKNSEVSPNMRKKLRDLSNERNFIAYDLDIYNISLPSSTEKPSYVRSHTETQIKRTLKYHFQQSNLPGSRSYSDIHHKKNQIQKELNLKELEMAQKLEVCKFRARSRSANKQESNYLTSNSGTILSTYEDSPSENDSFSFDSLAQFRRRFTNPEDLLQSNRRVQGSVKKVMVIQPFKDIPKLPDNFQQEAWCKLDSALDAIFNMHGVCYSQEELYNLVKNLCLHKFTEWLYNKLSDKLNKQISHLVDDLSISFGSFEQKLEFLLLTWKNYSFQICTVRPIFLYLEREYMIHQKNNRIISELGISIFKHYIQAYSNVKETLILSALELIKQERTDEVNNAFVIKELLLICIALDLYKNEFEPSYLSQTSAFYSQEAKGKLEEVSVPDYLKYAERRLHEEAHRITQYLDISTTKASMEAVETNIISQNCSTILKKGFYDLMDNDRLSDLKLLYNLVGRVNMLKEIEIVLELYVKERGAGIISTSEKEKVVQSLLNLKYKLETIFRESFDSNKSFQFTNRKSWDYFINLQSNMVAIEIAKFIDEKLRKSKKNLTDDEIDHLIDNVIYIFRHVLAKDVFEAFYSKRLAKRLLLEKSISSEAEKSVISKLKAECGNNFTNKISGMYKDMEISSTIMDSFKERYSTELEKSGISLHVWTLTGSKWPTPSQTKIFLPPQLQSISNLFNEFYVGINKGKILHWQSSLSHCLLSAKFSARKELFVSLHQAVILLLFNNYEQLNMSEIMQMTGLPEIEAKKELTSLTCLKYKILLKSSDSKTVIDSDIFRVNSEFRSKFLRITINSLQIKETKEEDENTMERVLNDRHYIIDAVIVRIMKTRKTLSHNELIQESFAQLRFPIRSSDIKSRIESLIERDYLARDEMNREVYQYLA